LNEFTFVGLGNYMDYELHCCDSFHDITYFKEMLFLKQCDIYAKNIIIDILRAF